LRFFVQDRFEQKESCRSLSKVSSLQTTLNCTFGIGVGINVCPRWRARRVPPSGTLSSVPVVQFPVPAGERDMQETPRKDSDTKERIGRGRRAREGLRGHCHRSCEGLAVLAQLANRADCQHVTG
jgi:hypothetical protein